MTEVDGNEELNHLTKTLDLTDEQAKNLKERLGIKDAWDLMDLVKSMGESLFDGTGSLFAKATQYRILQAGEWLDNCRDNLTDDPKWFLNSFDKSYRRQLHKKRLAAQEEAAAVENKRFKPAKRNQANASQFTAAGSRTLQGIVTLPPVYYEHLVPAQVKSWFTSKVKSPDGDDNIVEKLSDAFIEHLGDHTLKEVPETREKESSLRSVQVQHLDFIAKTLKGSRSAGPMSTEREFNDGLTQESRRTLANLGLINGVANSESYPDGYCHTLPFLNEGEVKFITTSIIECKDSAAAPISGHGEGAANCTAAAIAMAELGIPPGDVVVPLCTTTGSLMQFGAVYLLPPSLPVICFVTTELRLSVEKERKIAARFLIAMTQHAEAVQQYVQNNSLTRKPDLKMQVDTEVYHLKSMKDFFSCCGEGRVGPSLLRYLDRTSRLANKEFACLPVGIRLKDEKFITQDAIVFRKLIGYRIGLPEDANDRKALVQKMGSVVEEMHAAGVIHMDLYLSNILWTQKVDKSFMVCIIDFDAVHRLGEAFSATTYKRLAEANRIDFVRIDTKATKEHDTLYMDMIKANIDNEVLRVKSSTETDAAAKERLDAACHGLMQPILQRYFSQPS